MKYATEDVIKAARILFPAYKDYDLEISASENLLADNDNDRYYYEISITVDGKKKEIASFRNPHIRKALKSLCKVYGYCRISRRQQNIERQIRNIKTAYPNAIIVQEAYTGRKISENRPEWSRLYKKVSDGDTIIFDSVSRMSRNAEDGFRVYQDLYDRGVSLVFLKEPHINTDTYKSALDRKVPSTGDKVDLILNGINEYLMELAKEQIRLAFEQAQKEVDDLRQRTKEGIETARLNGKQIGQVSGRKLNIKKKGPAKEQILRLSRDFNGTNSDLECIKLIGISRNTYYKYKRELTEEII